MVQEADDESSVTSVHEPELLKLPPALPSLQLTVPVGVVGLADVSVTVAVYVIVLPMVTVDGSGATVVVVVFCEYAGLTASAPMRSNVMNSTGANLHVKPKDFVAIFFIIFFSAFLFGQLACEQYINVLFSEQ